MTLIYISQNFRPHFSKIFTRTITTGKNNLYSPENVFNENNIKKAISKFSSMNPFRLQTKQPPKKAVYLIPVCQVGDKVCLLFTLRQNHIKQFGGQVGFPGGMQHIKDRCLEDTAVRETNEKIGINASDIEIWASSNFIVSKGDVSVMPVLGRIIPKLNPSMISINPSEIKDVFTVSLETLCNPSLLGYTQFRNTYSVPVFMGAKKRIWGITAVMTNMCLSAILSSKAYHHKIRYIPNMKTNKTLRR